LSNRTGPPGHPRPGSADLRAKLILALAATGKGTNPDDMALFFQNFLSLDEPVVVRQAALTGLASTGEQGGPSISRRLNPAVEPEPEVRRQAAIALGSIKSFAWAQQLENSSRAPEPSPLVQEAAWQAYQKIMPLDDPGDLIEVAQRFKSRGEFERELDAIKVACSKMTEPASLAAEKWTIGDIYSTNLNMPAEAIPYYKDALKYFEEQKKSQPSLITSLLNAYLSAGRLTDAVTFSREQLQIGGRNVEPIGTGLDNWAERLADSNDPAKWEQVRTLIGLTDTLELDYSYKSRLQSSLNAHPAPATRPVR
jgi:tetratricopeptide (TPR) repeat protein